MRRLVAVLVVALLASLLVACGGEPAAEQPAATPGVGDAAPAPPAVEEVVADRSPVEPHEFEPFPVDAEIGLPGALQSRLDAGQPMIVVFYDSTQKTTDDQKDIVRGVTETYRGLIDVVSFDLGTYVTQDASGAMTVREGLAQDETAAQVLKLVGPDHLDVRFTPYVVVVDRQGYITWRYRGISDDKNLEREVLRVTD
ncbi:MAG TPA: hypothetical protein VFH17_07560 [Coriobacteriia bacterium]|nr:hypothetical protein [Coriobacteriia bacterium]